jgi:hypothetical protein
VSERLLAAARGKPLEVWFQDEARVGQQGTLTRIWARRGSRPPAPRDQRHHWAYIFGAVCPARATGAALVLPTVNAELMSLHLAEISQCVAAGAHAADSDDAVHLLRFEAVHLADVMASSVVPISGSVSAWSFR